MIDIDRHEYTAARIAERHIEAETHRLTTRADRDLRDQSAQWRYGVRLWRSIGHNRAWMWVHRELQSLRRRRRASATQRGGSPL